MATIKELEAQVAELKAQNQALQEEAERRDQLANSEKMRAEQLRAVLNAQGKRDFEPYVEKEKVPIKLMKDNYQYKNPLYLCINGRNMVIKRGVTVMVDKYVADFIEQMKSEQEIVSAKADQEEQNFLVQTNDIIR